MTTKYWIKLYHEILHDPKMARMDDTLWRRTIELFLVAGENFRQGYLPPLDDIAWTLHVDPEQLETELVELQRIGIISLVDGEYIVTKFAERQQPMPKAEYMQRKRNEEQRKQYYQPVTNQPDMRYQSVTNSNADKDKDIDKDREADKESEPQKTAAPLLSTFEAQDLVMSITGWSRIPGNTDDSANALGAIQDIVRIRGAPEGEKWLRQCYETFRARYPRSTKVFWITDWAVQGVIPNISKNGKDNESWKNEYSAA